MQDMYGVRTALDGMLDVEREDDWVSSRCPIDMLPLLLSADGTVRRDMEFSETPWVCITFNVHHLTLF